MGKKIKITLVRGLAGKKTEQKATAVSLGLKSPGQSVIKELTPPIQGMINAISFMVNVEEVK